LIMDKTLDIIEQRRLAIQSDLDGRKTQAERNRLGQFATPAALAQDILKYASTLLPHGEKVRFLDPAIGTGAFYSALRKVFPDKRIIEALGFEIDQHYGNPAASLWADSDLTIKFSDFTQANPLSRFNLVICNPPYVRHHHLQFDDKKFLQQRVQQVSGINMNGLAGLYCYFLGLSYGWMADGGIAGWLVPSEFMAVNYGETVKKFLLDRVTLLHIHRFDPNDVQFSDALVSSAIVWFRRESPPKNHTVLFTYGGTLLKPKLSRKVLSLDLAHEMKWTRFPIADIRHKGDTPILSDFFQIKRGLATGCNNFFILDAKEIEKRRIPKNVFRPILPSPRYLPIDEVRADNEGLPDISYQLFLLDIRLSETEIKTRYPTLYTYLEEGKTLGIHKGYICHHRTPWYAQENRPSAPIVCTYLGRGDTKRGRPFRFILNNSKATVANVYLAMYPTARLSQALAHDPSLIRRVWTALNSLTPEQLLSEGRVYGGGLHKLEPKELAKVDATAISQLFPPQDKLQTTGQIEIMDFNEKIPAKSITRRASLSTRR